MRTMAVVPAILLSLASAAASCQVPDFFEIEPNNSCATGTIFDPSSGVGGGHLLDDNDVDSFRIVVPSASKLVINVWPENPGWDGGVARVQLLTPSGALLAGRSVKSDSDQFTMAAIAAAGTYCVVFQSVPDYLLLSEEYRLSGVIDNTASALLTHEIEPNNTVPTATSIAEPDPVKWAQLASDTDVDYLRIDLPEAGDLLVSVDVENRSYDGSALFADLTDGTSVLSGRLVSSDINSALNLRARRVSAGPVYIRLAHSDFILMDKHVLIDVTTAPAIGLAEVEPNNAFPAATHIIGPGEVIGQLSSETDVDYYRVSLVAGIANFQLRPENTNYDGGVIVIQLRDSANAVLAARDVGSDSAVTSMNVGIGSPGDYYLVVQSKPSYQLFDKHYLITIPAGPMVFANGFE